MSFLVTVGLVAAAASVPLWAQGSRAADPGTIKDFSRNLAPYVTSPQVVVDTMLEAAQVKPGETVYDLGCGDGRILVTAVEKFKAKAVGVELNERLAKLAADSIKHRNMEDRARVIQGNMLDVDLSGADVVTLYLLTDSNDMIRPRLEKYLRKGSRVVSHQFAIRGWQPVLVEKIPVGSHSHTIYLYEIRSRKYPRNN
jgi:predicted RNA methylase